MLLAIRIEALINALPGSVAQGLIWGIMALGVYITFRLLDFADLTVDGSIATGGAVAVMLIKDGMSPWLALVFAFIAGMLASQTIINVGVCLGIFPVVGLTLPFFSYGGSSIVTMFLAMGVVSGIHMRPAPDISAMYIRPKLN